MAYLEGSQFYGIPIFRDVCSIALSIYIYYIMESHTRVVDKVKMDIENGNREEEST
jgi:hypothetical protein